jgi:ribosome biogenesis protein ENP2
MAEDQDDPNAFGKNTAGDTYDNFKFCTTEQLQQLELYHLRETTSLLRPYMHGYFVPQKLYEEARLISNPDLWQEQRAKSIAEKINKERESRIRGNKKVAVKVNRKLAEKMLERQDKADRKRAKRLLEKGGDENMPDADADATAPAVGDVDDATKGVLTDPRFARMFEDEDFEVDERSHEFRAINPSTKIPKGLTAAEQEDLDSSKSSSEDSSASEAEAARPSKKKPPTEPVDKNRVSSSAYRKAGHESQRGPNMLVSSSKMRKAGPTRDKSFGARVSKLKERAPDAHRSTTTVVGEREITFAPEQAQKQRKRVDAGDAPSYDRRKQKDRRPASNNAFRGM